MDKFQISQLGGPINKKIKIDDLIPIKSNANFKRQTRQMARSSNPTTEFEDPKDQLIYLLYPMTPDAHDVITIHRRDLKRLEPCVYFNDNLIDVKIKHMIFNIEEHQKNKVYAFSGLFYAQLTVLSDYKAAHALIARWTKNVNIFELDYIFFPIHLSKHWSLCTICKPAQWIQSKISGSKSDNNNEACFLHMDSLDIHPTQTIYKVITNYLSYEWKAKNKLVYLNSTIKNKNNKNNNSEENLFKGLPLSIPICPKQVNVHDCEVYFIKYVENILKVFPKTTAAYRKSKLSPQFENLMFSPEDVTQERINYKELLTRLAKEWKAGSEI